MTDWLSLFVGIITLFVTVMIPIQVMKFQRYTNLVPTYESFEFAHAQQCIINFFYDDCGCDVERIPEEYKKRFNEDFDKLKKNTDGTKDSAGSEKFDIQKTLHYQRRLLNDYFMELEMCRESSWFLRRIIRKDWTVSEAYICKILVYMNKAVDDDPEMFKDISSIRHEKMPKIGGLSSYLIRFYNVLKHESKDMQV